eukprot:767076-Hanusia_phi.AAC.10
MSLKSRAEDHCTHQKSERHAIRMPHLRCERFAGSAGKDRNGTTMKGRESAPYAAGGRSGEWWRKQRGWGTNRCMEGVQFRRWGGIPLGGAKAKATAVDQGGVVNIWGLNAGWGSRHSWGGTHPRQSTEWDECSSNGGCEKVKYTGATNVLHKVRVGCSTNSQGGGGVIEGKEEIALEDLLYVWVGWGSRVGGPPITHGWIGDGSGQRWVLNVSITGVVIRE